MRKMRMMRKMQWPGLGIVVLVLLLAACGNTGGASPTAAPTAPAAPTGAPAAAAATETPADGYANGTETPAERATAAPPAEDTSTGGASASLTTYRIVSEESQVGYTVDEVFLRQGVVEATAVGITQEISGAIQFDTQNPQNSSVGPITVDISTLTSDDDRRDNRIRNEWLESARFPIATFVTTQIEGLPESYTDGDEVTLMLTGDMTIRDVTNTETFTAIGTISGNEMRGTATAEILMTDYGFNPPDILNVLRAENETLLTLDFVARAE